MMSVLEKYRQFLPIEGVNTTAGLGEGNTPLVKSTNLAGDRNLYLKLEQLNPTGSFKDRFASLEATLVKHAGLNTCIATSSGNTGSAIAAYSAKHGLRCLVFVNEIAPENKLNQILVYGAKVFRVKNFGISQTESAAIFQRLQQVSEETRSRFVVSAFRYSPEGMEGLKTIAYEIVEQLGGPPDQVFVPVGGGGLLLGIWRGFLDLKQRGMIGVTPRMNVAQPKLNDTVVTALTAGHMQAQEVTTTTSISGLAVQVDIDGTLALRAARDSGGWGYLVEDGAIRQAQQILSLREGIFVEPAGATSVAGYLKAIEEGRISKNERVVCILTGHGLKDMSSATADVSTNQISEITASEINSNLLLH